MADLRVEMHGELLGHLVGTGAEFDFVASRDAVRAHGLGSTLLSLAIPLVPRANTRDRRLRQNFFAELLAEGDARTRLADQARVRRGDVIGLLRAYGRDVAGALQIWDPDQPGEPSRPAIERVDGRGVEQMLLEVSAAPLGNRPRTGKSSLNGVQSKIVLVRTADGWARAIDGYPSTHIVKPVVARHPSMIFDEEYGSRFARALGLADFDTHLDRFGESTALVITRYDRDQNPIDGRVHQEDFNQILGLSGDQKYETYGTRTLREVARHLTDTDRIALLKMTALSAAVGNLDMHAKNISLLHLPDGSTRLAPMYDVVPQTHEDNDGELAFRVGGEFEHRLITRDHLIAEGASWSIEGPGPIIDEALTTVQRLAIDEDPHPGAHHSLRDDIIRFSTNLIEGRTTHDSGDGTFSTGKPRPGSRPGGWTWDNPRPPTEG